MPTVTLAKDHVAAIDGVNAAEYAKGDKVEVSDEIADHWRDTGVIAGGRRSKNDAAEEPEGKALEAPENK